MTDEPIGLDPDRPLTGGLVARHSAELNLQVAEALARFNSIHLQYPRHVEFHARCDLLMKLGGATRGSPQTGMRVIGPSGSGKSTAAAAFQRKFGATTTAEDRRKNPVVLISSVERLTTRGLMIMILNYFGDHYSDRGNELSLTRRVHACFERFESKLLMADEVQHLSMARYLNTDVTDSIKRFLDVGALPVVFLGTEEALPIFTSNIQLTSRLEAPCDFAPLNNKRDADRALFAGYVGALDRAIVDTGIFPRPAVLTHQWIRSCLHSVSEGIIGRTSRVLREAVRLARLRGAECIEVFDLANAVDSFAVPVLIERNPFRDTRPSDAF